MIYLICQPSFEDGSIILKVGYTNDLVLTRLSQYESHCPSTILLAERQGGLEEESLIHRYFRELSGIMYIKSEWYKVPKSKEGWIIKEFYKDYKEMGNIILDNPIGMSKMLLKYFSDNFSTDPRFLNLDKSNRISVRNQSNLSVYRELLSIEGISQDVFDFAKKMSMMSSPTDRLKEVCEKEFLSDFDKGIINKTICSDTSIYKFYNILGPDICKNLGYDLDKLQLEIDGKFPH